MPIAMLEKQLDFQRLDHLHKMAAAENQFAQLNAELEAQLKKTAELEAQLKKLAEEADQLKAKHLLELAAARVAGVAQVALDNLDGNDPDMSTRSSGPLSQLTDIQKDQVSKLINLELKRGSKIKPADAQYRVVACRSTCQPVFQRAWSEKDSRTTCHV
jgi:septal ring factor EnvC (AmiA/AmiB activator)